VTHSPARAVYQAGASRLALALALTAGFVVIETAGGLLANSLALLTDAAHNLTDVLALGLSWFAVGLSTRTANSRKTFGYHRAGILAALLNSTTLALVSLGVSYQALRRLLAPPPVQPDVLLGIGSLALVVNLITALLVKSHRESDLNRRATFLHLMGDVLSSLAAVLAGLLLYFTGANWLDPLAGLLIGGLILWNAWGMLRETLDILLESTPRDVDMNAMVRDILRVPGVLGVHDLHVWSITQGMRSMSAHILTGDLPISIGALVQRQINDLVAGRYHIAHATLQLECAGCEPDLLYCDMPEPAPLHQQA
jgi:cobalt-zinc-cadmium efflux system protein